MVSNVFKDSTCIIFFIIAGAIAITGGLFSNNSIPVVIGRLDCNGTESIMECFSGSDTNQEATQCDPSETAAISCQGTSLPGKVLHMCIL